jgi:hypothetical protein
MPRIFINNKTVVLTMVALGLIVSSIAIAEDNAKEQERVQESGNVIKELANSSNGIPIGLLKKA